MRTTKTINTASGNVTIDKKNTAFHIQSKESFIQVMTQNQKYRVDVVLGCEGVDITVWDFESNKPIRISTNGKQDITLRDYNKRTTEDIYTAQEE